MQAWPRSRLRGLDLMEPGRGHYYAIRGPEFLIEYDNTQNDANHIHAVWRDLERTTGVQTPWRRTTGRITRAAHDGGTRAVHSGLVCGPPRGACRSDRLG